MRVKLGFVGFPIAGLVVSSLYAASAQAAPERSIVFVSEVHTVSAEGVGPVIGKIYFTDTAKGLDISTELSNLAPGEHGFHIHENPDCGPKEKDGKMTAAQAAGGHFDPHKTGKHLGPHGGGHQGDLPKLVVAADGKSNQTISLEGVKFKDVSGRSVMVHAGGDTYSDSPAPLGGGGARIACGVIP